MKTTPNGWTPVQEELARNLYHSRMTDEDFKAKVGKSRGAWKSRLYYVKCQGELLAKRKEVRGANREDLSCHSTERSFAKPNAEQLADAKKRCELRTPIRDILGDPAPGYSMLDKRVSL